MLLKSIQIKNYRSIEDLSLETTVLDDNTYSYGLIGVNEAGKSSILKALALKEGLITLSSKDFRDKSLNIEISFVCMLTPEESKLLIDFIVADSPSYDFTNVDFSEVTYSYQYSVAEPKAKIQLKSRLIKDKKASILTLPKLPTNISLHTSIFWTAEEKYLISAPINLSSFSSDPENISVPLRNCFLLAGISEEDIEARIANLAGDSTEIEQLQDELGKSVTEHINTVWPNHPIKITFLISNGLINFHIKDIGTSGKSKTADQRSDGFKQFVSFLLTISAQNLNEELSNSILLLDEPETHLHPQAQEHLLEELKKITKNNRNNIVLFATHSNYMIDKSDLSRNYRIDKVKDKTIKTQLSKQNSTYASVNYEVFGIVSTDYHNELYAKLHERYQDADPTDDARSRIKNFDANFFVIVKELKKNKKFKETPNEATLPTYIRNCIHHPDNGDKYTEAELKMSTESLISYL